MARYVAVKIDARTWAVRDTEQDREVYRYAGRAAAQAVARRRNRIAELGS